MSLASISDDLIELRRAVVPHLSQREVARRMKISSMFLSDLERGRRDMTPARREQYIAAVEAFRTENSAEAATAAK